MEDGFIYYSDIPYADLDGDLYYIGKELHNFNTTK